jgi:uncharacterized protein (TIGR03083 family)
VPSCPGWRLRDLAHHLGNVHAWAERATRQPTPPEEPTEAPQGRDDLIAWYAGAAASLLERLRTADPDEPCWHFGAKPRTVGWWVRRQAHETAVHLWDAQAALGHAPPLEPGFAADGVAEVLDVFVPRQVRMERIAPLTASVRLVATDADLHRSLGDGEPVATLTGTASDLLLLLWGRVPADRLEVTGDPSPVLSARLVP